MKTPNISHLTKVKCNSSCGPYDWNTQCIFNGCNPKKQKLKFQLIYDRLNFQWLFKPIDFYTVYFVSKSSLFYPWPRLHIITRGMTCHSIRERKDTWRLAKP